MTLKVFLLLLATTVAVLQAQGKEDEMKASNQEVVEESESLMETPSKKIEHLEEIVLALSKKMQAQEAEIEALQKLVEDKEIRVAAVEETVVPGFLTGNDDLDELEKKLTQEIRKTEDYLIQEILHGDGKVQDYLMQEILHGDRTVQDRLEETVETIEDSLKNEIHGLQESLEVVNTTIKVSLEDVEEEISNLEVSLEDVEKEVSNLEDVIGNLDNITLTESAHCGYQDHVSGSSSVSTIILYDRVYEEANTAGSYMDGSSGYFTAGKKGTYLLTLSAEYGRTVDNGYFYVYLRTSSGKYQDGVEDYFAFQRSYGTSQLWTPLSAARFVSLDAEETVHLEYTCYGACHIWSLKFCIGIIN